MKRKLIALFSISLLLLPFNSCHPDESYHCYLLERTDYFNPDTLDHYDQGLIYKKSKPEEECSEDRWKLDSIDEYDTFYYECSCGWKPD